MTYVNAGQCRPMLLGARDGTLQSLAAGGLPVGLVRKWRRIEQGEVVLEPGDVLLACSDGVSEAMNPAEEIWDEAHVEHVLRENAWRPAAEIIDRLVAAVDEFAAGRRAVRRHHRDRVKVL